MNTRAIAAEYRLAHWAQIMEDRGASGTTIREFCKQTGYAEHVYYYWQRKLREAACQELLSKPRVECRGTGIPEGWAVCAGRGASLAEKAVTIEIGGCKVVAEPDVDPELLKQVCLVLLSIC